MKKNAIAKVSFWDRLVRVRGRHIVYLPGYWHIVAEVAQTRDLQAAENQQQVVCLRIALCLSTSLAWSVLMAHTHTPIPRAIIGHVHTHTTLKIGGGGLRIRPALQ